VGKHGLSAFTWLFVLFLPLLILAWMKPGLVLAVDGSEPRDFMAPSPYARDVL